MKKLNQILESQSKDKIIEMKICKYSGEEFPVFQGDLDLIEKISPVISWKKYIYDTPNISPKIRQIFRLAFRNERKLYNIELNWKKYISTVHPDMRKNILKTEEFFDTDFSKINIEKITNFDSNFTELLYKVPYIDRLVINAENSPYVNQELNPKNCHLISWWMDNQDSMYSTFLSNCEDMIDCYSCGENSNNSYETYRVHNCNKFFFTWHAINSYNVYFSMRIVWCKNIIFWYDLNNQEYIYKDKQYSKEDWEKIYVEFKEKLKTNSGLKELKQEYIEFLKSKNIHWQNNIFCENSFGSAISSSQNVFYGTQITNCEDVRYWNILIWVKDSMDVESYWHWEKLFNVASWTDNQNTCAATTHCWWSNNTFYSLYCEWWNNNFGCFGLKNKEYHIFNKSYSKENWEKEVVKIIEEKQEKWIWWEFFDISLSPFPYNDSVAMEYFPPKKIVFIENNKILSSKDISENWVWTIFVLEPNKFISKAIFDLGWEQKINIFYRTKEQEINIPEGMNIIFAKDIPDSLDEIDDSILEKAIICEVTKRPFRISKKELQFYKKHWISLPRIHYDIRHLNRLNFLPNREISVKKCEICQQDKLTNYPNYKNICEECYNKKK